MKIKLTIQAFVVNKTINIPIGAISEYSYVIVFGVFPVVPDLQCALIWTTSLL